MDHDKVIAAAVASLDDASTSLLLCLSKMTVVDPDSDEIQWDPATPMAAALRSISRAAGLLEALGMN
jgi:hypothetical protein